jgi:Carboxypeptidase regulatory-like domain/TonB-dependent Receptor Plug Domain
MKPFSCLLLLVLCLVPACVLSQSTSATISGGVTDPTGNFIPDASVEVVNDETGVRYSVQTNSSGMYFVPILPPGHYRVQVSRQGFKTIIKSDVVLNVQGALALNFVLPVGATSQSITVEAGSSLLNTTDATVSTVIDRKFVENMPLNGRSFQDLISMTPGVVTQSPQSSSSLAYNGDFSVNGQRTESNYYTVDGVSGNSSAGNGAGVPQAAISGGIGGGTALGTTQSLVSVDALQEFRVQSSTYSAEYGRSPGGQFSLVTRSGTSILHGTVFDYLRNNFFDANDWFNDHNAKAMTALRQNDFGGTLGGPLLIPGLYRKRDQTFFFGSYEGLRLTQPQAATIMYVPDTYMRQQAAATLQPILNAYPVPNGVDYGNSLKPSLAEFIEPYSLPAQVDATSARLDHTAGPWLTLFFRFSDTPSYVQTRSLSVLTTQQLNSQTYTLGSSSKISNSAANEARLGYSRGDSSQIGAIDGFGGAVPINLSNAMGIGGYAPAGPLFYLSLSGVGTAQLNLANASNRGRQWNLTDTFSWTHGHHSFKAGMDYRKISSPTTPASPNVQGIYQSSQAILTNAANTLYILKRISSTPIFNETAAFVQDEWSALPRLNPSLGLRWEVDPPPTEANGNLPYTLLGNVSEPASLALAPQGTPLWKTTWYNFAPRVGVAWRAVTAPGHETVVRVGGGVFFDTDDQQATYGFLGVGFQASRILSNAPLPVTPDELNISPSTAPPYTSSTIYAFPDHLQLPYTLQWNASVEQALGRNQALTISYIGANGRRLIGQQEYSFGSHDPNFGTVIIFPANLTSNYQALQLKFQRSVTRGVHALASYTWSHSLDYGSNAAALPIMRGNSDFDVRNNLSGGLSWDLPRFSLDKIGDSLLNDWGIDGRLISRSAFPIPLLGSLLTDPASGAQYYGGLNFNSASNAYSYGSQYPGGRALNKMAFSLPVVGSSGSAPRNFLRGFDATQLNLAIRREFPIYENIKLQFRAETFNLLNHPMFGYVDPVYADATFGQATKMLNASLGTMASQYQQGPATLVG